MFQPCHQDEAKRLVLAGLGEHWGWLDPNKNLDLEDIAKNYDAGSFLVALSDARVIGTGAILPRSTKVSEIVRMSVDRSARRTGVGTRMLCRLVDQAHHWGCKQVILETTKGWHDAIYFYEKCGFKQTHCLESDVYFALDLA